MAVPKRKMSRSATRSRKSANMQLSPAAALAVSELRRVPPAAHGVRELRLVPGPAGARGRVAPVGALTAAGGSGPGPVIAVDAMGGDRAPAGDRRGRVRGGGRARRRDPARRPARRARRRTFPAAGRRPASRCCPRSRSSRWATSPRARSAPRRTRRSSAAPKRSATAGPRRWSAPATPARRWPPRSCAWAASAACTGPRSRCRSRCPGSERTSILLDAGATVDPEPEWLVQWARLGRAYAKVRLGVDEPTIALLSNGEEAGQGRRPAQAARSRCSPS